MHFPAPFSAIAISHPHYYSSMVEWSRAFGGIPIYLHAADRKEWRRGDKRQWYFTHTLTIPHVNHRVRIVILWDKKNDVEPCKILVTNRVAWEVSRILQV